MDKEVRNMIHDLSSAPPGPLSHLRLNNHEALIMRHHGSSFLESIESRQRQYYRALLSNRDDEAFLAWKVRNRLTAHQTPASTPVLPRSELEVVP